MLPTNIDIPPEWLKARRLNNKRVSDLYTYVWHGLENLLSSNWNNYKFIKYPYVMHSNA